MKSKIIKKELLRFLVGGGSAVVIDFIAYKILLSSDFDISLSKLLSYICGATVGFVINKYWTFECKRFSNFEIIRYTILYIISACVNAVANKLIIIITGFELLAFLCATGASTILNFIGQKFFVFVKKEHID